MGKQLHDEYGSSLVELALLLPVFLLLILGLLELGRSFRSYIALDNAAREGARWLTVYPSDSDGARTVITTEAARAGLNTNQLTITITPVKSQYQAGDLVTVRVACAYPLLFGAITKLTTLSLVAQVTMRVLYG